jgi:hypothetical protein
VVELGLGTGLHVGRDMWTPQEVARAVWQSSLHQEGKMTYSIFTSLEEVGKHHYYPKMMFIRSLVL